MFANPEFILSAAKSDQYPKLLDIDGREIGEIAFAGRSNAGKSSLINHLTKNNKLAHVSSTPGKTQMINFFTLDNKMALVDLPGYGFAKVPKSKKEEWGNLIQDYLHNRQSLSLILLLCDLRHPPTNDDILFVKWAIHFQKPLIIVFTKADKLRKSTVASQCTKHFSLLCEGIDVKSITHLTYSIKDVKARVALIKEIEKRMQ